MSSEQLLSTILAAVMGALREAASTTPTPTPAIPSLVVSPSATTSPMIPSSAPGLSVAPSIGQLTSTPFSSLHGTASNTRLAYTNFEKERLAQNKALEENREIPIHVILYA